MRVGVADLGAIDLGGVGFGDRQALARVLGGKVRKVDGRWRMLGGVHDSARLDHPTVLRVLGAALPGEVAYIETEAVDLGAAQQAWAADSLEVVDMTNGAAVVITDEMVQLGGFTGADQYRQQVQAAGRAWEAGPLLLAYFERLICPAKIEYVAAIMNELAGGVVASVPDGMAVDLAADVRRRVGSLVKKDGRAVLACAAD